MKNILLILIDYIILRIYPRIEHARAQHTLKKKVKIISKFKSVGFGLKLNGETWTFIDQKKILIGNNVHIGNNAFFHAGGGIIIGDNTHISRNVTIYTSNHEFEGHALPYDFSHKLKSVVIERNVWIGMNVSIRPGVRIGEGSVIGIGCVINEDVPPLSIVGSKGFNVLRYRNKDHYYELNENKSFGGVDGKLLSGDYLDKYRNTYYNNRKYDIVFIVSTGRSGSTTIVDALNAYNEIEGYHEDIAQLTYLSYLLSRRDSDHNYVFKCLDSIFKYKVWQAGNGKLLLHSDQKFWNLIPYLASYFPNSKFIHLQREAISCIKSMVARGWYVDSEYFIRNHHEWAEFRIRGDEVGAMSYKEWSELSQIEKCSWYYSYVNNKIEDDISKLSEDRRYFLQLEELSTSLSSVKKFLNLSSTLVSIEVPTSNKVLDKDKSVLETIDNIIVQEAIDRIIKWA